MISTQRYAIIITLLALPCFASDYDVHIQALQTGTDVQRAAARQMLPRVGIRAVPDLIGLLQHEDQRTWRTAGNILSDICHAVMAPGHEVDRKFATNQLIALLNDEVPPYTRIEALRLLGKVAPEGHDLAALVPYLSQPQFRSDTIDALVAMSSTSAQNILESQLDHGTNQDKIEIIDALRTISLRTDITLPAHLLDPNEFDVQIAAMRALASSGDPSLIGEFMEITTKVKIQLRPQAIDASLHLAEAILQRGGNWNQGIDLYRDILDQIDSPNAKGAALAGLGRYGDASVIPEIFKAASTSKARDLQAPALMALNYLIGRESSLALLSAYPAAPSEMQLGLLGVMGRKKDPVFLDLLLKNAASNDPTRQALAFEALVQSELPGGADAVTAYVQSRPEDERKLDVEKLLIYADVMSHKNAAPEAGKAYLSLYQTTDNDEFRKIAFEGIRKYPSPDALKIILTDLDITDLPGESIVALVALSTMMDPREYSQEINTLRKSLFKAARNTGSVQSILSVAMEQGVLMDIAPLMGFFTRWSLIGPFPWSADDGFSANPINAPFVDLKATYRAAGKQLKWRQYVSGPTINAAGAFGQQDSAAMFGYVTIDSNGTADIQIRVASDDGVRVWFNGESVHENNVDRGMLLDDDIIPVKLKKGKNELHYTAGF
ncbi:MAG: hypothetical protein VCC01_14420, partial [Candidatus Hydrogenedentota bacterium]